MEAQDYVPSLLLGNEQRRYMRKLPLVRVDSDLHLQQLTPAWTAIPLRSSRVNCHVHIGVGVSQAALGAFFTSVLHAATPSHVPRPVDERAFARIRSVVARRDWMTLPQVACLFSALPHTRSLYTLRLEASDSHYNWTLTELELRWIAYAVFHPQTPSASWRKLVLGNCTLDSGATRVLETMASGSKRALLSVTALATLMSADHDWKRKREGDPHVMTSMTAQQQRQPLRLVRVRQDSVIRTHPTVSASECLATTLVEGAFEVCDATTASLSSPSPSWRCVLVPGYGFGWVHERDVVSETDWTAAIAATHSPRGYSPLTSLGLGRRVTRDAAVLFLTALGTSLESLAYKCEAEPRDLFADIARLCPSLRSLRIESARGPSFRSALERYLSLPTMRSLQVLTLNSGVCGEESGLWTMLSDPKTCAAAATLRELRVDCVPDVDLVVDMLASNRTLKRMWFYNDRQSHARLMRFDGQALSSTSLAIPLLSALTRRSRQNGRDREDGSAFSAIAGSRDVLALICAFAAPRREVHIGRPRDGSLACCGVKHAR